MKTTLVFAVCFLFADAAHGALSINANGVNPPDIRITSGGSAWDTVTFPPSGLANIYFDADSDGVFGEAGENSGNTVATLSFTIDPIISGRPYLFAMEGFTNAVATGTAFVDVTRENLSVISLIAAEGVPTFFSDSNGTPWRLDFTFNQAFYGNVVFNGGVGPGQNALDHQGVLVFTALIPEPATAMLGLLGLAALMRRRRTA